MFIYLFPFFNIVERCIRSINKRIALFMFRLLVIQDPHGKQKSEREEMHAWR